jgi:hypothetical protein
MKLFLIAATAVALVSASAAHAQNSWPFAAKAMPLRGFLACTDPDNRPFTINYDLTTGRATLTDTAGPLEYIVTMDAADVLHLTHDKTPSGRSTIRSRRTAFSLCILPTSPKPRPQTRSRIASGDSGHSRNWMTPAQTSARPT